MSLPPYDPDQPVMQTGQVPPTQTLHPWRATLRTAAAGVLGLLSLLPVIAVAGHVDAVPFVAQILTVSAAATRVLAIPGVDAWLRRYAPWLAAQPKEQ